MRSPISQYDRVGRLAMVPMSQGQRVMLDHAAKLVEKHASSDRDRAAARELRALSQSWHAQVAWADMHPVRQESEAFRDRLAIHMTEATLAVGTTQED